MCRGLCVWLSCLCVGPGGAGPGSGHARPAYYSGSARPAKSAPLAAPARACVAVVAWRLGDRLPRVGLGLLSRAGAFQPCGRWSTRRLFTCRPRPLFLRCAGLCPLQPSRCGGGARSNARLRLARACVAVVACVTGTGCRASAWAAVSRPPPSTQLSRGRGRSQFRQRDSWVTGETGGEQQRTQSLGGPSWALYGAEARRGRPRALAASGRLWGRLEASKRGAGAPCPPPLQGGIPAPPGRAPGPPEGGRRWYGYPVAVSPSRYPSAVSR